MYARKKKVKIPSASKEPLSITGRGGLKLLWCTRGGAVGRGKKKKQKKQHTQQKKKSEDFYHGKNHTALPGQLNR